MKFAGLDKHGFDWKRIIEFCKTNIRYISAGCIVVALAVVLAVTAGSQGKKENGSEQENGQQQTAGEQKEPEKFAEDVVPEINTLIQSYYGAYAAGDIAALETYATPISDLEKGHITVTSQYVTAYENIQCHSKAGLAEGEYAVSVVYDMRLEGVETMASGLGFFYVRQNESGAYYIDNLYSAFNLRRQELELDSRVAEFIAAYEAQEDVSALIAQVQEKYAAELEADANLKALVTETIPGAWQAWLDQMAASADGTAPQEPADTAQPPETPADTPQTPEEPADTPQTPEEPADTSQTPEEPVESEQGTASETVYATRNVKIRKEPSETSEQLSSAIVGQSFTRIGEVNGWSEIVYHEGKAYIKSDYLSTEKPEQTDDSAGNSGVNYLIPETELTMSRAVNVRKSMDENSERIGTAEAGDTVTVVMSYAEGWTKVEWNGKTGYIKTDLLLNN